MVVMHPAVELITKRSPDSAQYVELLQMVERGHENVRDVAASIAGGSSYDNLQTAMATLEWLISADSTLAILLMMGLFELADQVLAHDICDAVELWIDNEGEHTACAGLDAQAAIGAISSMKANKWRATLQNSPRK